NRHHHRLLLLFLSAGSNVYNRQVFTKCDKLNQSEKAKLKNEFKDSILVSNLNKFGLDSLEDIIINQTLGLDK
ncbi:hypothetical protein ACISMV_06690, partial [Campylobacter jejuni]